MGNPSHKRPPAPQRPRTEVSAGGIVFQRTAQGPLVAFLLDPYGKWTFAKGHVRRASGESLAAGAVRETQEEMGLVGLTVHGKLGTAEIWFRDRFKHKGSLVHKYITYFLMEAPSGSVGYPQKGERIQAIAWVPLDEAGVFSNYDNLVPVVAKALRWVERITGHKSQPPMVL